tara:strand:- start:569 stop:970 length:402 start_codon:yes stop_codon:yes gene_type:complete
MNAKLEKSPSNHKFGFVFTVIFVILGLVSFVEQLFGAAIFLNVLAVIFLLITLLLPNILTPLNKLWMNFGVLLGTIVNPIVLGIIFFGLFMPIGLIMKLLQRDELNLKFRVKGSYWKKRDVNSDQLSSFKNPF